MSAFPFFVEGLLVFVAFSYISMLLGRIPLLSGIFAICGKYCLIIAVIHIFVVRMILALFYTLPTDTVFPPLSTVQILVLGLFDVVFIVALCVLMDRVKTDRTSAA